jgi:hypothetical protein
VNCIVAVSFGLAAGAEGGDIGGGGVGTGFTCAAEKSVVQRTSKQPKTKRGKIRFNKGLFIFLYFSEIEKIHANRKKATFFNDENHSLKLTAVIQKVSFRIYNCGN